jgi:hypothetical protein
VTVDDATVQAGIQQHLQLGEKILWSGQPDPSRLLARSDAFLIPFSLMWGGFAIVWEAGVLGYGAPIFFGLWGIPFVVVGQYIIWGRFVYKRWDRRRTAYALTSQRVLILRGRSLQSVFLTQLPAITQSMRADGSGSLEFGVSSSPYGHWGNSGMEFFTRGHSVPAFYDIPDVAKVYGLIDKGRSGSSDRGPRE